VKTDGTGIFNVGKQILKIIAMPLKIGNDAFKFGTEKKAFCSCTTFKIGPTCSLNYRYGLLNYCQVIRVQNNTMCPYEARSCAHEC